MEPPLASAQIHHLCRATFLQTLSALFARLADISILNNREFSGVREQATSLSQTAIPVSARAAALANHLMQGTRAGHPTGMVRGVQHCTIEP